jgi:hypothetical protein
VAGIAGSSPEPKQKGAASGAACGASRLVLLAPDDGEDDDEVDGHGGEALRWLWPRGRRRTAADPFGLSSGATERAKEEGRMSEGKPGGWTSAALISSSSL